MGSSRAQERSLGTAMSLSQWVKGRMDNRYDFDQSSFSPPSHDDSFFYIRYPKSSETGANSGCSKEEAGYRRITQALSQGTINPSGAAGQSSGEGANGAGGGSSGGISQSGTSTTISSSIKDVRNIDFSKHPLPCQPYIPAADRRDVKSAGAIGSKFKFAKSQGTDDGFHGEPALCGKSIVDVANRIMSTKLTKIESDGERKTAESHEDAFLRKGSSKSLPVTPIASPISTPDTSPKLRRKMHTNRYFTGPFIPDREKYQAGWILSSILGQSREVINNRIEEEEEEAPTSDFVPSKFLSRKKSISTQNLSYFGKEETRNAHSSTTASSANLRYCETQEEQQQQQQQQQQKEQKQQQSSKQTSVYTNVFQAKPSELREMNFWSPTSM